MYFFINPVFKRFPPPHPKFMFIVSYSYLTSSVWEYNLLKMLVSMLTSLLSLLVQNPVQRRTGTIIQQDTQVYAFKFLKTILYLFNFISYLLKLFPFFKTISAFFKLFSTNLTFIHLKKNCYTFTFQHFNTFYFNAFTF